MGPSWAPDGTEVLGSSSSSVFRVDALTGQQLRGYREAGGKLTQGKQEDTNRAASALGDTIFLMVHARTMASVVPACTRAVRYNVQAVIALLHAKFMHVPLKAEGVCR